MRLPNLYQRMTESREYCPDCRRVTEHQCAPGGWPVCVNCGHIQGGNE